MPEVTDRLVVELSANVDKFKAAMDNANGIANRNAAKIARNIDTIDQAFAKAGKTSGLEAALARTFDTGRLAAMEQGASRIGVFGGALEALGPAGLVAAAGIGAAAVAFEGASKAADWAEELQKTAKVLGLSTTQLQEFDFVATATGIPVDKMRESLAGLNTTVGKVIDGLARGQTIKAFAFLHLDQADLRNLGDLSSILPVILDRASKLGPTQLAGVAAGLKVAPDVLQSLIAERDKLTDLIAQAHSYGIVLDESVIAKSAEAASQLHIASDVISKEMTVAFAELSPTAAGVAIAMAHVAQSIANVIKECGDALEPIGKLIAMLNRIKVPGGPSVGQGAASGAGFALRASLGLPFLGDMAEQGRIDRLKLGRGVFDPSVFQHDDAPPPLAAAVPGKTAKAKKAPKSDLEAVTKDAAEQLAASSKALADAQAALTTDITLRAEFEHAALTAEEAKQDAALKALSDKIDADKTLTPAVKARLKSELVATALNDAQAADAKGQKIDLDAQLATDADALATKQRTAGYLDEIAASEAALADTAAKRVAIERQNLLARQKDARDALERETADKILRAGPGTTDANKAQAAGADALSLLKQSQGLQLQTFDRDNLSPFAAWVDQARKASADVETAIETEAVKGINDFNSAIADAIVNGKNMGDAFKSIFKQMETDLIQYLLKQAEIGVIGGGAGGGGGLFGFLGSLFGIGGGGAAVAGTASTVGGAQGLAALAILAGGGSVRGAGTSRSDSILARLSDGEFVVNADAASGNMALLQAINSGKGFADGGLVGSVSRLTPAYVAGGGRGPMTLNLHSTYDLRGASGDKAIDAKIAAAHRQSVSDAVSAVQRSMGGWQVQQSYERG